MVMCGYSKPRQEIEIEGAEMRKFYLFIAVALVLTVLIVAFVPGAADTVERVFQQYLGRAAR